MDSIIDKLENAYKKEEIILSDLEKINRQINELKYTIKLILLKKNDLTLNLKLLYETQEELEGILEDLK